MRTGRFDYDLAYPGDYRTFKFVYDNLSVQDMSLSTSTEVQRVNEAFDSTSRATACQFESAILDGASCTILHLGDNAAFSRKFITTVDYDSLIQDIQFNFAIGMNVSAYTNGGATISSVDMKMTSFRSQGVVADIWNKTWVSTLASMTAVDNQIFIIQDVRKEPFPLFRGGALELQITVNTAITGTNTVQIGIIPVFPYQATGSVRSWAESSYRVLQRALPKSGDLMRESTNVNMVPENYAEPVTLTSPAYTGQLPYRGQRARLGGLNE